MKVVGHNYVAVDFVAVVVSLVIEPLKEKVCILSVPENFLPLENSKGYEIDTFK